MKNFTRHQLFQSLLGKQKIQGEDQLDKKALEGYQYLHGGEDAGKILNRLDSRFEVLLDKHKASTPKASTKVFNMGIIKRLAAAVLILLIPLYFLLKGPSDQRLYAAYFEAPISSYFSANRGVNTSDDPIRNAFQLYESMQYEEASQAIQQLVDTYPEKEDLVFYEGIALLEGGNTEAAILKLSLCLEKPYNRVDQMAPWYLALAHLKNGDRSASIKLLEKIADSESEKATKSNELLKKLQ